MPNSQVQIEDTRISVPDGGIASFIPADNEMDDDVEDYGSEGIAQFPALAQRMAAMGRNGDNSIAHVQTGELVIPAALLERDPVLKANLFQRLRDMGIEDPERYVVGSESNSLNPDTGMPEFSWLGNLWKNLTNFVKKVATVVLPIALSLFTPLGPIFGSALGSGIATLINGGSFKDALKSAAVSGITAGVFQGFTGGQGSFGANVKAAVADPLGRLSQTMTGLGSTLTGGGLTGPGNLFTQYVPTAGVAPAAASNGVETGNGSGTSPVTATETVSSNAVDPSRLSSSGTPTGTTTGKTLTSTGGSPVTTGQVAAADVVVPVKAPSFGESIKAAFTPNDGIGFGEGMKNAFFPKSTMTIDGTSVANPSVTQVLQENGLNPLTATAAQQAAARNLISEAAPGMLRSYAPLAGMGMLAAGSTGMFTPVPGDPAGVASRDEDGNVITGESLITQNPGQYLIGDLGGRVFNPETGQYEDRDLNPMYQMPTSYSVPTSFPTNGQPPYLRASTPGGPFERPYVVQAAEGGAIFPRRNGGILPDEGVSGQDSVRAMLMPGEFVMTNKAVRGAGNGNVQQGIHNMYSMMRNLETRGGARA